MIVNHGWRKRVQTLLLPTSCNRRVVRESRGAALYPMVSRVVANGAPLQCAVMRAASRIPTWNHPASPSATPIFSLRRFAASAIVGDGVSGSFIGLNFNGIGAPSLAYLYFSSSIRYLLTLFSRRGKFCI